MDGNRVNEYLLDEAVVCARRLSDLAKRPAGAPRADLGSAGLAELRRQYDRRIVEAVWNTFDVRRRGIREAAQDIGGAGELYLLFSDLLLQCPNTVLKKGHWIRAALSSESRRLLAREEKEKRRFLPYDEEYDPSAESTEPKHEVMRKLLEMRDDGPDEDWRYLVTDWKELGRQAGLPESDT